MGRQPAQYGGKQLHQQQRHTEFRQCHAHHRQHHAQPVNEAVLFYSGHNPQRDTQNGGQQDAETRNGDGTGQPGQYLLQNRSRIVIRSAEIQVEEYIFHILEHSDDQRVIQAQLFPFGFQHFHGGFIAEDQLGRVTGNQAQKAEDQRRNGNDNGNDQQQSF